MGSKVIQIMLCAEEGEPGDKAISEYQYSIPEAYGYI